MDEDEVEIELGEFRPKPRTSHRFHWQLHTRYNNQLEEFVEDLCRAILAGFGDPQEEFDNLHNMLGTKHMRRINLSNDLTDENMYEKVRLPEGDIKYAKHLAEHIANYIIQHNFVEAYDEHFTHRLGSSPLLTEFLKHMQDAVDDKGNRSAKSRKHSRRRDSSARRTLFR